MTCVPFVKLVEWKFESEASEFAEWNYNQVEFKERLSNEDDKPWPWSESLKSVQGEEPNNCALAHCRCKNAEENFDHLKQTLRKIYSRQDFVQD